MDLFFAIDQADKLLLEALQASVNPLLIAAMLALTFLGNPVFWVGIAALFYWRGQENKGFFLMNVVVMASAAAGLLKHAFLRPRPAAQGFKAFAGDIYSRYSFPSGHSTIIGSTASYFYKTAKNHWKILLAIAVILVGFSRLYLGMHFPSVVAAGIAFGIVIGKLNTVARNKLFHRNFIPSKLEEELALVLVVAMAVVVVVFFKSLPMAGLFLGFYAGFFLFKEMKLKQSILLHKMLAVKYAIGFAVLLALVLVGEGIVCTGLALNETKRFALYALGGFWISWIWPIVFEKAFRAKQ